jgi:hypothetical protein
MPQVAAVAPSPTPSRPPPEVCRNTLLDKLGKVGLNHVRQVAEQRYKEVREATVPNSRNPRIEARGSACDDPRVQAVFYDLNANGMLQSITYAWARPAGPKPSAVFQERLSTLSRFYSLPPPQSPGQLQANISTGLLVLWDIPDRSQVLEAYAANK